MIRVSEPKPVRIFKITLNTFAAIMVVLVLRAALIVDAEPHYTNVYVDGHLTTILESK
jgi:hypothetical protein